MNSTSNSRAPRRHRGDLAHVRVAILGVHAVYAAVVDDQAEVRADAFGAQACRVGPREGGSHLVRFCLRARLAHRLVDVVHAGDLPAVLGQVDGVVTGAATDVQRGSGGQGSAALDQVLQALRQRVAVPRDEAEAVEGLEQQLPRGHHIEPRSDDSQCTGFR